MPCKRISKRSIEDMRGALCAYLKGKSYDQSIKREVTEAAFVMLSAVEPDLEKVPFTYNVLGDD